MGQNRAAVRGWAVAHAAATVLLVVWNGVASAPGVFPYGIGEISDRYSSSFTPADYAFAIWGPIYLGLLAMAVFGLRRAFSDRSEASAAFVRQLGAPFVAAQAVCGLWLVAWLTDSILTSLLLMMALWTLLMTCVVRLDMERWDAPWNVIAFVWWPISIYSGWITVALLANVSAYLASLGVSFVAEAGWAIALAVVLSVFNLAIVWLRNMREFSMVAVWALVAVAVRHGESAEFATLRVTALCAAALIFVSSITHAVKNFTWPPKDTTT